MRLRLLSVLVLASACAAQTPVDRALGAMRQHREADAETILRQELDQHPDDLPARRLLVRVLGFRGDLDAARAEVDALSKRLPDGDPGAWIELGHAYELAHRFEEALAAYDEAAARAPASPAGPREGGMRCARWGEVDAAAPRLEEAVKRGAKDAEVFHVLGLVRLHQKNLDGAEAAYRQGLAVDPTDPANMLGLATVAVTRDDAKGALLAYDALLAKHPRYGAGYLGRAWALARLGRKAEAKEALDQAEELGASPEHVKKQRELVNALP
ncbi:MAG TPA: tetratricopeptide repeat protein [Polyangiaceae bacterium]